MKSLIKYLIFQVLRILEKLPGINLVQTIDVRGYRFLLTPKVCSRTLRDICLAENGIDTSKKNMGWRFIRYHTRRRYVETVSERDVIVVREPLKRLHSCWKQKVRDADRGLTFYFFQYWPKLKPGQSFLEFLEGINKIATAKCEKHFIPMFWEIESVTETCILLRDDQLDVMLLEIGAKYDGHRSNTTKQTAIGKEDRCFYENHLINRYSLDQSIYDDLGTKRTLLKAIEVKVN